MAAPKRMVEFAHMKPHKDAGDPDDMDRWGWMMGYAYRGTFHIDNRLNVMPLNVYVHRLLDANLITFVLDADILKIVKKKLRVNSSAKRVTEERQRILTDLDKEMPDGGWPVTLLATQKCDKTEALMVHDLAEGLNGCLTTAETYQVFKYPFAIPFRTAASPIFILANMWEQQANLSTFNLRWYQENWKAEQWNQFNDGTCLIKRFVHEADVPECYKRRAPRNTRESSRGETVPGPLQDKYDYYAGKYEAEKSTAEVTKSSSDNPENECYSDSSLSENECYPDSEEEREVDGKEPFENLLVHSSPSKLRPIDPDNLVFKIRGHVLHSFSQTTQPPESISDDADNEIDDGEPVESLDPLSEVSEHEVGSRLGLSESSEASSEYADDETGSEIGRRDSPLRLRPRTRRS